MTTKQEAWEEKKEQERNAVIARSSATLSRSTDTGLRYRKRALWIVGFYLPLLIVPWILTCVMMHRPVMLPSYISQKGAYSMTQIRNHEDWHTAVDVINRIATVLGVPVVSTVLAQGAVVYAQRRTEGQTLSIRQLLPLADRGWTDVATLWNAFWYNMGPSTSSLYLWLGALLVLITAIQQPMQSILVTEEPKLIVTCNDNPTRTNNDDKTCDKVGVKNKVIAYGPEPQELAKAPQIYVVHRTLQNILSVSSNDVQPRLWRENLVDAKGLMDTQRQAFRWIYSANSDSNLSKEDEFGDYYVSSILNGTNTGVLREHAVRMDSRAQCQHEDSFPDECAGDNPFTYTYTSNLTEVEVCAEGSINTYPFTRSRNKQEISERIWFSLQWIDSNVHRDSSNSQMENYTMSCEATTRRGWFELGNYQNDFQPSGMLEKWPSQEDLEENFNDYTSASSDNDFYPVEEEASTGETGVTGFDTPMNAFGSTYHDVSGPLMMAALALFGNNTYFHTAANTTEENTLEAAKRICQSGRIPFAVYSKGSENGQDIQRRCSEYTIEGYEEDEDDDNWSDLMSYLVGGFLQTMEYPEDAQRILEITMFFANEALLTGTAEMGSILGSRSIYAAPGYQVLKPQKTLAGIIVITILIGLQTFGLLFLLRFIYSIPAWTGSFDSDALVQIGGQLREQDQRLNIGSATGLVGILARDDVPNTVEEEASDGGETLRNRDQGYLKTKEGFKIEGKATVPLALGGPGIVTKRVHKKTL